MSEFFIGEIKLVAFAFAPRFWAQCNGQLLPINQNQALFSLLGTQYGGNGTTNFALPDLRGRVPFHMGQGPGLTNRTIGEVSGSETVTLIANQMPAHTHTLQGTTAPGATGIPVGNTLAQANTNLYAGAANTVALSPQSIATAGGSQPHPNMQPYLVVNFVIALSGIYPSRN